MNITKLSWSYLKAKPLNTLLNVILFTLGIAIIVVLLLFSKQLENKLNQNTKGIDLVVGAKGSPLQIILCSIFHIDFPTGNILLQEAEQLTKNRQVKSVIPLALGDSYGGYRIVGTSRDYPALYQMELELGSWWTKDMEVTLGYNVAKQLGLEIGAEFEGQHGLTDDGHSHGEILYKVVGSLKRSGSVMDNLIFTNVQSVWAVHEHENEHEELHSHSEGDTTNAIASRVIPNLQLHEEDSLKEITSLLIKYRSPMGAIQLPRYINGNTNMQAASPAFEAARLFSLIGVGVEVIQGFAYIIIFIAMLSIFIALYNSLKERKYDLAIMRSMGATKTKLFISVILEGIWITLLGSLFGTLLGHLTIEGINILVPTTSETGITGRIFLEEELLLLVAGLLVGLIAAVIPAIQVFRTDISGILAKG
ncbi:ABC transporter permease [Fulvivirgaceae bacterium BMA10]|uniref:ABC transporter permease n=1 Tax=Splendidivirga corallicola TaxID=3051826 RepID=A0ABT8KY34_9BACT|nr:ABC transporter permease [Fulvivirgaceae bacterium BMA10]